MDNVCKYTGVFLTSPLSDISLGVNSTPVEEDMVRIVSLVLPSLARCYIIIIVELLYYCQNPLEARKPSQLQIVSAKKAPQKILLETLPLDWGKAK